MKKIYNNPTIDLNNFMLQDVLQVSDGTITSLESILGWGENDWNLNG